MMGRASIIILISFTTTPIGPGTPIFANATSTSSGILTIFIQFDIILILLIGVLLILLGLILRHLRAGKENSITQKDETC